MSCIYVSPCECISLEAVPCNSWFAAVVAIFHGHFCTLPWLQCEGQHHEKLSTSRRSRLPCLLPSESIYASLSSSLEERSMGSRHLWLLVNLR